MRRGELLNLTLGDYNRSEATLHIRETKFFKSRLLPINPQIADEIESYLRARARKRLPTPPQTATNMECHSGRARLHRHGLHYCLQPLLHQCGIKAARGSPRESTIFGTFAVNALCAGIAGGRTSTRSCHCWRRTWGMGPRFLLITTCTSSSRCAPPPVSGSPRDTDP